MNNNIIKRFKLILKTPPLCFLTIPIHRLLIRIFSSNYISPRVFSRLSKIIVSESVIIILDNIPGKFKININSHMFQRVISTSVYEPEITNVLQSIQYKNKDLFVNIGANVGFFSVFAAKTLGFNKILAFEPNPEAFLNLQENILLNNLNQTILALPFAISEHEGITNLSYVTGLSEYSSINGIAHPGISGRTVNNIEIVSKRLNNVLHSQKCSFIFIDVEGAELLVFKGAEEILIRDKPMLLFECSDLLLKKFGSDSKDLINYICSLGYKTFDASQVNCKIKFPYSGNILAVPNVCPN